MEVMLPVRYTGESEGRHAYTTVPLEPTRTIMLLVDCDGDCNADCNKIIEDNIAPALAAARAVGIKGVYLYGESLPDGPNSKAEEIHKARHGRCLTAAHWRPSRPIWSASIAPREDEPIIAKCAQNGFVNSYLDRYLRAWDIETLLLVGFSFKSCLFYTAVGAFEHNYRLIFLRDGTDPPGANEFADTADLGLPEGGWVRTVLTRLIEDHLGYSSTCPALTAACQSSNWPAHAEMM